MEDTLRIFTGSANPSLGESIARYLNRPLGRLTIKNFADGEVYCEIEESVRGMDIFVVQPTCNPVNDNLMELLILIDTFRRSSARSITAVLPYYGYARQDRRIAPRTPISARLVADLINATQTDRVVALDLHAGQIQGFFHQPFDHIFAMPVLLKDLRTKLEGRDIVVVSPDAGGVERARAYSKRLGANLAIIDKRRPSANVAEVMNVVGDVEGKTAVFIDDMIDTAGTLTMAADAIKSKGAESIYFYCTHPVFSGPAVERLTNSHAEEVVVTNSIPLSEEAKNCGKIRQLDISELLGEAIFRIYRGYSVSALFV